MNPKIYLLRAKSRIKFENMKNLPSSNSIRQPDVIIKEHMKYIYKSKGCSRLDWIGLKTLRVQQPSWPGSVRAVAVAVAALVTVCCCCCCTALSNAVGL